MAFYIVQHGQSLTKDLDPEKVSQITESRQWEKSPRSLKTMG